MSQQTAEFLFVVIIGPIVSTILRQIAGFRIHQQRWDMKNWLLWTLTLWAFIRAGIWLGHANWR